jgi:hypothetical protein
VYKHKYRCPNVLLKLDTRLMRFKRAPLVADVTSLAAAQYVSCCVGAAQAAKARGPCANRFAQFACPP